MRGIIARVLFITLTIGLLPLPAQAHQPAGELRFLELVEATLEGGSARHTFTLAEGGVFSLWAETDAAPPNLSVLAPDGSPLATGSASGTRTVIEALTAPASGTYTVTLSGQAGARYRLQLLPGYGRLDRYDTFDAVGDPLALPWQPVTDAYGDFQVVSGEMQMQVMAEDTLGFIAPATNQQWSDFYVEADVRINGTPPYYEYGFLLRMDLNTRALYAITFNSRGEWVILTYDGGWQELQPWTTSPVIDTNDLMPHIGVLAQGNTFRLYFNRQLVGEVVDPQNWRSSGTIALTTGTRPGQTDPLTVFFDNLVITTPAGVPADDGAMTGEAATPAAGQPYQPTATAPSTAEPSPTDAFVVPTTPPIATRVPPTPTATPDTGLSNWDSPPEQIVAELRDKGLVPSGGGIGLQVPNSFGDTTAPGFSFYPLGRGSTFTNFVLGFDATLTVTGPESGCGMHFWNNDTSTSFAMVMEQGGVFLAQATNDQLHPNSIFVEHPAVIPGTDAVNQVVVVVIDGDVTMYVNGALAAQQSFTPQTGTLALEVFVAEDDASGTQRTYCELNDIWLWEF